MKFNLINLINHIDLYCFISVIYKCTPYVKYNDIVMIFLVFSLTQRCKRIISRCIQRNTNIFVLFLSHLLKTRLAHVDNLKGLWVYQRRNDFQMSIPVYYITRLTFISFLIQSLLYTVNA